MAYTHTCIHMCKYDEVACSYNFLGRVSWRDNLKLNVVTDCACRFFIWLYTYIHIRNCFVGLDSSCFLSSYPTGQERRLIINCSFNRELGERCGAEDKKRKEKEKEKGRERVLIGSKTNNEMDRVLVRRIK